jgi:hypothetical protein
VRAARLVDAEVTRKALTRTEDANLVVIIDERLFREVVTEELRGLRPQAWTPVRARAKNFDETAYLYVPGHAPRVPGSKSSGALEGDAPRARSEAGSRPNVDLVTAWETSGSRRMQPRKSPALITRATNGPHVVAVADRGRRSTAANSPTASPPMRITSKTSCLPGALPVIFTTPRRMTTTNPDSSLSRIRTLTRPWITHQRTRWSKRSRAASGSIPRRPPGGQAGIARNFPS